MRYSILFLGISSIWGSPQYVYQLSTMSAKTKTITSEELLSPVKLYEEAAKDYDGYFQLVLDGNILPRGSTEVVPTGPECAITVVNLPGPRFISLEDLGKKHGEPIKAKDIEGLVNGGSVVAVFEDRTEEGQMFSFYGFLVFHAPPSSEQDWNTFFESNFRAIKDCDHGYYHIKACGGFECLDIEEWPKLLSLINFERNTITGCNFKKVVSMLKTVTPFAYDEPRMGNLCSVMPILYLRYGDDDSDDEEGVHLSSLVQTAI